MKKAALLLSVLFTFILAGTPQAQQTGDSQTHHPSQQQTDKQQKPDTGGMMGGQGMGMMGGQGMGMMGGQGMGMMGGQGMGMMGRGMGSGMMHGGMNQMNRNMMAECGWVPGMKTFTSPENHTQFLEDTKELRRNLYNLRFEYGEKARNPETTIGELQKMEEQMSDLQKQIREKAAQYSQQ